MSDVPQHFESALSVLGFTIEHHHNINPCNNSAEEFETTSFKMAAYDWSEQRDWNFKWRDVEIQWYKYHGRGMWANRDLTIEDTVNMLEECLHTVWGEVRDDRT